MAVRAGSEQGATAVRSFKVPETVNLDAFDLKALIGRQRPSLNQFSQQNMSLAELDALKLAPLELPPHSLPTHSRERAVKLVIETAESVCGWANKDDFIRTQLRNRKVIPSLKTKKDFLKLFLKDYSSDCLEFCFCALKRNADILFLQFSL